MRIRPAPGLAVRHPVTREFIPEDGLEVEDTDQNVRRLLDTGDVVDAGPIAKKPKGEQ